MKEFLLYFAQTALCGAALLLLYRAVVLRRATFRFSRAYLIFVSIASLVIPLLNIPVYPAREIVIPLHGAIGAAAAEITDAAGAAGQTAGATEAWEYIYISLYIAVAAILTALILRELFRIRKIRRSSRSTEHPGYRIYESPQIESPFSTAKSIYLGDSLEAQEKEQVIVHESSHIRHGHFYERLLLTILRMLFWFNPFIWIARRYLIELHEYQADRDVLTAGYDMTEYRRLILNQILGYNPDITCGLNNSLTKKRFLMMTTKKLKRGRVLRIAAPLLMTGGLVMLFGFTAKPAVYSVQPEPPAEVQREQTSTIVVRGMGTANASVENLLPETESKYHIGVNRDTASKTIITVYSDSDGVQRKPLILVDGIEIESVESLEADMILGVNVLKDAAAIEKYGERAKEGVILITTKNAAGSAGAVDGSCDAVETSTAKKIIITRDPATETSVQTNVIYVKDSSLESIISGSDSENKPMIIVNGVVVENIDHIPADNIMDVTVLKNAAAIEQYGEEAKNGVIVIKTKVAGDPAAVSESDSTSVSVMVIADSAEIENTDHIPAILPIDRKSLKGTTIGKFNLQRKHPVTKEVRAHTGVDLPAAKGVAVYATADGTVLSAESVEGYGNLLTIEHGNGYRTRYAHLSSFNVKSGETVKRGGTIGKVGSSGHSSGEHLHYEVIYLNQPVDPLPHFGNDTKEIERLAKEK